MIEIRVRFYEDDQDELARKIGDQLRKLADEHGFEVTASRPRGKRRRRQGNPAEGFLKRAFEEQPRDTRLLRNDLVALAAEEGISESRMDRAKAKLQIKSYRQGSGKGVLWGPPGSKVEPEIPDL
jgi:hypothetical protein